MSILKTTDFASGRVKVSQDQYNVSDFADFITDERNYMRIKTILGNTLGQEFIDDLTGDPAVPQTAKFTTIFSEFEYEYENISGYSIGLKEILKRLCYYDYVTQQAEINQSGGNKVIQHEASQPATFAIKLVRLYNEAIDGIRELQLYVNDNDDTYTDFDGKYFEYETIL